MTAKYWAALIALVSPTLALSVPQPIRPFHPSIVQVICDEGLGTAFSYDGKFISVAHVTSNSRCTVNGELLRTVYSDKEADFSIMASDARVPGVRISCEGFANGAFFYSVGHARGLPVQRTVVLRASDILTDMFGGKRWHVLVGPNTVVPGMSGGPIFNNRGEVVGAITAYNPVLGLSYSIELKGTSLCQS